MRLDWLEKRGWRGLACALALVMSPAALAAQEPYDEDEWWDPTDWFDGNNVEWDDTYEWWDEGLQDDDYGYSDYDYYDPDGYDYGWHYEWDPAESEWSRAYGWYDEYYDDRGIFSGDEPQYGWHYEWDDRSGRWDRVYGWYDEYYESTGGLSDRYPSRSGRTATGSTGQTSRTGTRTGSSGDMTFSGRIEDFQRMSREPNLLVRMRLEDGTSRIVDLGPKMELSRLDLQRGDRVTIRGERMLRASSIEVAGQPFRISRADSGSMRDSGMRGSGSSRQRMDDRSGQTTTFEGKLEGFKKVGTPEGEHVLVRLTLQDGSKRVVDFGTEKRFRELGLDKGDRVMVRGDTRRMQGQQVLVADQIRVDGERFGTQGRGTSGQAMRTLSGEVRSVQQTRVEGLPESNTVLRLRMENGETHLVDLGRAVGMDQLRLGEGDEIRVSGRAEQVSGRTVIDANQLRVNGRTIALDAGRESGRAVEAGSRRQD